MEDEQERREEGQEEEVRQEGQEEEVGQEGQEEQVGQEGQEEEGEEVGELSVKLTAPRDGCLWPMYHTAIRKLKKKQLQQSPHP